MEGHLIESDGYKYYMKGGGTPLIILHGLMGGLSNFDGVSSYFPTKGYKVIIPELPLYNLPILKTNVKDFAKFLKNFINYLGEKKVILIGNSLGGHIGLLYTKLFPEKVKGLIITGSSGLYENSMGESYPKRENYQYIKKKTQQVFYSPKNLPRIFVKTAIIWGKQDVVTPPDVGKEFNKLLPNSTLFWIDKCGHAPMMEHPNKFNHLVNSWLVENKL